MRANDDVREILKQASITQWKVAEKLGIHEKTLSVWMRKELKPDKKQAIFDAIEEIKKAQSHHSN